MTENKIMIENKIKDIRRYIGMFLESNNKPLSKFNETDLSKFLNSLDFSLQIVSQSFFSLLRSLLFGNCLFSFFRFYFFFFNSNFSFGWELT